jgi:hypothetical protein
LLSPPCRIIAPTNDQRQASFTERLPLSQEGDAKLVAEIERLISSLGGLNVARRLFLRISPAYDDVQERYHLIRHANPSGGGAAQVPFGYLFLLSIKYAFSKGRNGDTDQNWHQLLRLATDYAALLDVQTYVPNLWLHMDALALLRYLRELAVYDTLFRIPQIRGKDVVRLVRGVLDGLDFGRKYGGGWSINEVLAVTSTVLSLSRVRRGPFCINVRALRQACPKIDANTLQAILNDVLCHPTSGANQRFSRPGDAPVKGVPELEAHSRVAARFWQLPRPRSVQAIPGRDDERVVLA